MKKKTLLALSLTSLIGLTGSVQPKAKTDTHTKIQEIKKKGRINTVSKTESLNAVGEIALETLNLYVDASKYNISRIVELKDFNKNDYVLVEFNPIGYLIYNVSNGDVVECSPTSYSPYLKTNSLNLHYLPMVGYFSNISGRYTNLIDQKELSELEIKKYKEDSESYYSRAILTIDENNVQRTLIGSKNSPIKSTRASSDATNFDYTITVTADTEVPYAWYFKKNLMSFAQAGEDSCGYIAIGLLMSYNEIFRCTGYFSTWQAQNYITPYRGYYFEEGVPDVANDYIYKLTSNPGPASQYQLKQTIKNYLSDKPIAYTLKETTGLFTNIEKPIKDGFPAIYLGNLSDFEGGTESHAVVVYGLYNTGKLLCHYGWTGFSQVIMSQVGLFSNSGALSIYDESVHVHNTYFILNNQTYCGCGQLVIC